MARSAKRAEQAVMDEAGFAHEALGRLGGALARNPALVGATTALVVALSFVSANALWYQPHAHLGALLATRGFGTAMVPRPDIDEPATTIRIERPAVAAAPVVDPEVERVQKILTMLNLYQGKVDGISGPNTRKAVADYQKLMGLVVDGEIDDRLLRLLSAEERAATAAADTAAPSGPQTGSIVPRPVPRPTVGAEEPRSGPDPRISRIQAGLRAFGNPDLELDGVAGARTRAAIREFQTLFGLPVTGEPDEAVYAKMRAEGYIN